MLYECCGSVPEALSFSDVASNSLAMVAGDPKAMLHSDGEVMRTPGAGRAVGPVEALTGTPVPTVLHPASPAQIATAARPPVKRLPIAIASHALSPGAASSDVPVGNGLSAAEPLIGDSQAAAAVPPDSRARRIAAPGTAHPGTSVKMRCLGADPTPP